jgi:DnaJ family protein B protein 4
MKWHPDKHMNKSDKEKTEAENKFKEINEAYEILSCPDKRKKYDMFGNNAFTNNNNFHFNKADDVFKSFYKQFPFPFDNMNSKGFNFNGMPNGMPNGIPNVNVRFSNNTSSFNRKRKDKNIIINLNLTLEELYTGTTKKRKITRNVYNNIQNPKKEEEILDIEVKPGWKSGTKIRYNNKGDVKPNIEPSDLIFIVKQIRNDNFIRNGDNLRTFINITYLQALNGIDLKLKFLNGEDVEIKLDKIDKVPYTHVVMGKGMPIQKYGKVMGYGNLFIDFIVHFKDTI